MIVKAITLAPCMKNPKLMLVAFMVGLMAGCKQREDVERDGHLHSTPCKGISISRHRNGIMDLLCEDGSIWQQWPQDRCWDRIAEPKSSTAGAPNTESLRP